MAVLVIVALRPVFDMEYAQTPAGRFASGLASDEELRNLSTTLPMLQIDGRLRVVPDIIGMSAGPYFFSPRSREMIDRLEPGVHRYHEVSLVSKTPIAGRTEHGPYYLMANPPRLDCVVDEQTEFWSKVGGALHPSTGFKITLRRSVIAGHHCWMLLKRYGEEYFLSDELWSEFKKHKVTGFELRTTAREI